MWLFLTSFLHSIKKLFSIFPLCCFSDKIVRQYTIQKFLFENRLPSTLVLFAFSCMTQTMFDSYHVLVKGQSDGRFRSVKKWSEGNTCRLKTHMSAFRVMSLVRKYIWRDFNDVSYAQLWSWCMFNISI